MRYLRILGPTIPGGLLKLHASGRTCFAATADGGSVEMRCNGTHIQSRINGGAWADLVALTELRGLAGLDGIQGEPGTDGAAGEQGPQGAQGPAGAAGSNGAAGTPGAAGAAGAQGIQGVKGDKGDTGNTGSAGSQGTQGIQGIQGLTGNTGSTGSAGTNGTNGSNGLGWSARALKTSADQTLIGTSFATVTGLDMAVAANTSYLFEYWILADVDATTTGVDVAVTGPASPTQIEYECEVYTSATATAKTSATAYDANSANANSAGTARRWYKVKGVLRNGANAGNLSARIKREAVGTGPNVRAGSFGLLTLLS